MPIKSGGSSEKLSSVLSVRSFSVSFSFSFSAVMVMISLAARSI